MSTFDRLSGLALTVERYELEGLRAQVSSGFERLSTVVHLHGAGHEGVGEDVVYDAGDQELLQQAGPVQPVAGEFTLGEFCELTDGLDLFAREPEHGDVSRLYRRWTFQSAALDLALRQAGTSLHEALGRQRPAADVRRLAGARRPGLARAAALAAGRLPDAALQARRQELVDARADRRAGRHRRGRLGRFQGPVSRHGGRRGARPGALSAGRRGVPARLVRGPRPRHRGHRRGARRRARPDHLGRPDPLDRGHRVAAVRAADGQHQAEPGRRTGARCARPTTTAPSTASAPTAAASSSSAPVAARRSTWPRCFIPTRPTTWRPSATTRSTRPPGCRRARWRPRRARPAFAGRAADWLSRSDTGAA